MKRIGILGLPGGNIGSLRRLAREADFWPELIQEPEGLKSFPLVVVPGVGHAASAMEFIRRNKFDKGLEQRRESGDPLIGICLGFQVFGTFLHEGKVQGLSWIEGEVQRIRTDQGYNIGWARVDHELLGKYNLARGLTDSSTFFFNHQFGFSRSDLVESIGTPGSGVVAMGIKDNFVGFQFHPEKSQAAGDAIFQNVARAYFGL